MRKAIPPNAVFLTVNKYVNMRLIWVGGGVKRGLFKSANGKYINADVNGSYNIMRKAIPNVFANGIEGVVVHPLVVKL